MGRPYPSTLMTWATLSSATITCEEAIRFFCLPSTTKVSLSIEALARTSS